METNSVTDYLQSLHDLIPALQMGLLPDGVGQVYHKFAESINITTTSSIMGSNKNQDPFNITGLPLYISSSSAADTELIYLEGVDQSGVIQGEYVTLQGQTGVALTTVFRTIFRGFNANGTSLTGDVHVGSETIPVGGVPAIANEYAHIPSIFNGKQSNQSLTSIFTVPMGFTAFLTSWYGTAAKGKDVALTAYARAPGKIFRYQESMFNFESSMQKSLPHMKFPEGTDFKVEAITSQGTVDGVCTYDIILVSNDFISKFRPLSWR